MADGMTMKDTPTPTPPAGYADWLASLKTSIHHARQRAALAVNQELIGLYWQIGRDILQRQAEQGWGTKVIDRLSRDLRMAFPEMKGFSPRNLKYMRAFAESWPEPEFVQQLAAQLPWGHNQVMLDGQARYPTFPPMVRLESHRTARTGTGHVRGGRHQSMTPPPPSRQPPRPFGTTSPAR